MTIDQKALTRPIVGIENRTAQEVFDIMCDRFRLAAPPAPDHADDLAVDRFADAMKAKLKWEREERGRGGWQNMSAEELSKILVDHLPKGDPVDVANLAMMLGINRQQIIMPAPDHAGLASRVFYPVNNPSAWPDGFNQNISDLLHEAATALSAGVGATVKPLVWVDESWTGRPLINYGYGYNPCRGHFTYTIEPSRDEEKGEGFFVSVFLMHPFVVASVAWRREIVEAKAAAQADYEARVLAQLAEGYWHE